MTAPNNPTPEVELVERLTTLLADFDAEVADHINHTSERADLWDDIDIPVSWVREAAAAIASLTAERDAQRVTIAWMTGQLELEKLRSEASNKLLSERIAGLEAGLERLASPEAFHVSKMPSKEETMRMFYAEEVLKKSREAKS